MQPTEVMQIVNLIVAADGRTPTEQMYGAWTLTIGHLTFDLAREAAIEAMRDEKIRYVEPKHVLSKVNRIREVLEQNRRREMALEEKVVTEGKPVPICRDHGKGVIHCKPCAHKAYELSLSTTGLGSAEYEQKFWDTVCFPQ
jgi:hypothetical protein